MRYNDHCHYTSPDSSAIDGKLKDTLGLLLWTLLDTTLKNVKEIKQLQSSELASDAVGN